MSVENKLRDIRHRLIKEYALKAQTLFGREFAFILAKMIKDVEDHIRKEKEAKRYG